MIGFLNGRVEVPRNLPRGLRKTPTPTVSSLTPTLPHRLDPEKTRDQYGGWTRPNSDLDKRVNRQGKDVKHTHVVSP